MATDKLTLLMDMFPNINQTFLDQSCKSVGDDEDKFNDVVEKLLGINANLELLNIGIDNHHTHDSKKARIENVVRSEKTSDTSDSSKQMRNPFADDGNKGGIVYEHSKQPEDFNYYHSRGMNSIPPYSSHTIGSPPNAGTSMYAPSHPAYGMQTPVAYPYSYPHHFLNDPNRYVPDYGDSCGTLQTTRRENVFWFGKQEQQLCPSNSTTSAVNVNNLSNKSNNKYIFKTSNWSPDDNIKQQYPYHYTNPTSTNFRAHQPHVSPQDTCHFKQNTMETSIPMRNQELTTPNAQQNYFLKEIKQTIQTTLNETNKNKCVANETVSSSAGTTFFHGVIKPQSVNKSNDFFESCKTINNVLSENQSSMGNFESNSQSISSQANCTPETTLELHYLVLITLLPDEDSSFLRNKCKEINGNVKALQEFVLDGLSNNILKKKAVSLLENDKEIHLEQKTDTLIYQDISDSPSVSCHQDLPSTSDTIEIQVCSQTNSPSAAEALTIVEQITNISNIHGASVLQDSSSDSDCIIGNKFIVSTNSKNNLTVSSTELPIVETQVFQDSSHISEAAINLPKQLDTKLKSKEYSSTNVNFSPEQLLPKPKNDDLSVVPSELPLLQVATNIEDLTVTEVIRKIYGSMELLHSDYCTYEYCLGNCVGESNCTIEINFNDSNSQVMNGDIADKCCQEPNTLGNTGNSGGGTASSTQNYSHFKVIDDTHSEKIHNFCDIDENTTKASYEETFNDDKNHIIKADTPIFIADDSSVVENIIEESLDGVALTLLFKNNDQAIVSVGDNVVIDDKDDDSAINKHISEDEKSIACAVDNNSTIENLVTKENSDSTATVQLIVNEEAAAIPIGIENNASGQISNDNTITQLLSENKDDVACSSKDILIEETLDDGAIAKIISEEEEEIASGVSKGIVEEYFDLLLNYIPEADPEYLQAKCESFVDDPTQLEAFVQECLETGNSFPSIDDYLKRQEVLSIEKEHLNQITVSSLIEYFPRPFDYFYVNKKKEKEEENYELGYLQRKFRTIADEHLKDVLENNNHNLSSSVKELELWSGVLRPKRGDWECDIWPVVNMPFLYEAKLMESRLECGICCNNELEIEEMAACIEGHLFCKDCVTKNAELRFGEGHSTFPCLESCGVEFSMKTLQGLLNPTMFSRILKLRMLEDVKSADIENLEMCPFCEYVAIVPPEMMIFTCDNPECLEESCRTIAHGCTSHPRMTVGWAIGASKNSEATITSNGKKLWCGGRFDSFRKACTSSNSVYCSGNPGDNTSRPALCKEKSHTPLRCDEVEKEKETQMRTEIEDRMTEALVRCPLFTNDDVVHREDVKKAGEKAKADVTARNPSFHLKIDPTSLLPEIRNQQY
uniref:(California timema) hypothetical protein n=1 Tax=Timema californicum TaxID=61474 RepID=A0A7R9J0W9_TIMCA|nr:unnamed protein product [Timema californicum]